MLNLGQLTREANQAGISLRERLELEGHIRGGLRPLDAYTEEDHREQNFRAKVVDVLTANGLAKKGTRYLECSRFGYCLECDGPLRHRFFSAFYCDLRFCSNCGARTFARLYQKYAPILSYVRSYPQRGFLIRKITLTSKNTGLLTSEQIKKFNEDVKATLKTLLCGVEGWGALWCDEVGFNNFNLHAHILFYGPYIPQQKLARVWKEVSGHEVVWISRTESSAARALSYLLKYVSKVPADDPEIVGQLEVAFHGRRRVHTLGVFYAFAGSDPDHVHSEWTNCPKCGAGLRRIRGTQRIDYLILNGLRFIGEFRAERTRQQWAN
jgi:ribosomal protein S27AE